MLTVALIVGRGVFPVCATGIVVGAVTFFEAILTKLEEVEPVALKFNALGIAHLDGLLRVADENFVFTFDVDVEAAIEVDVILRVWVALDFDRTFVNRVVVFAEGKLNLAHLGHGGGVGDGLGHLLEGEIHFVARFQVELLCIVAHAIRVGYFGTSLDTK